MFQIPDLGEKKKLFPPTLKLTGVVGKHKIES